METILNSKGNHTVVTFRGNINFENADTLLNKLRSIIRSPDLDSYILDMNQLDFVGSCGISKFMRAIISVFGENAKCIGLKSEFKRCFKVFSSGNNRFKYYSNIEDAIMNFEEEDYIQDPEEEGEFVGNC